MESQGARERHRHVAPVAKERESGSSLLLLSVPMRLAMAAIAAALVWAALLWALH